MLLQRVRDAPRILLPGPQAVHTHGTRGPGHGVHRTVYHTPREHAGLPVQRTQHAVLHTVHAVIVINNFTLTFDFMNGTKTSSLVTFNGTIVYPENVTREGYSFDGWNDTVERMPGYDLTIFAIWYKNKLPSRVIAFITLPCVISWCVIVAVIIILFVRRKEGEGEGDYDLNAPLGQFSENLKQTL